MEKQFIPYEQALELKELGFDEPCFGFYVPLLDGTQEFELMKFESQGKKVVLAPLWQQAFDWLWNKTGRYIIPIPNDDKEWLCMGNKFKTYEEARLECLKKLINIIK